MIQTPAGTLLHVRCLPEVPLRKGLLGLDLVVPQRLKLALVVFVSNLLVLFNDLVHVDLAAGGHIVW
jgi:hypothetical protein